VSAGMASAQRYPQLIRQGIPLQYGGALAWRLDRCALGLAVLLGGLVMGHIRTRQASLLDKPTPALLLTVVVDDGHA
jgi:hypothetical protein